MKEGAIQYADPLPFLDLVCVGTATQTEVEEQVDLMYSLIHQQVDAIVLVPIDSKALVQPVVEAVRKGVPVINIDIRLDTQLLEQAGVEVAFVGPDNFAAAYEVGKLLDKKLRNEDKVAIIEGLAAAIMHSSVKEVYQGDRRKRVKIGGIRTGRLGNGESRRSFSGVCGCGILI